MKKIIHLIVMLCACATFAAAQNNSGDYKKLEVFAGYTIDQDQREPNERFTSVLGFTPAQLQAFFGRPFNTNSGRTKMNGLNVSATGYVTKNFGITGDFSAAFKNETQPVGTQGSAARRRKFNFLAGPQYKFRNSSRVEPFARALFGVARLSTRLRPDNTGITIAGLTVEQIDDNYTAFAMGIGGGLDVRINKRVKLRLIQVDYNPVFAKDRDFVVTNARLGGQALTGRTSATGYRRDNVRFSFGIVF